jgi:hypothetical protein
MTLFREAGPGDLDDILRLYRQLQPADPVLTDGSDAAAFAQILGSPACTCSCSKPTGSSSPRRT